eukprot:8574537-Lingulodinium_polyedra.AAC.1
MARHPTASFVGGKAGVPIKDGVAEDIQRALEESLGEFHGPQDPFPRRPALPWPPVRPRRERPPAMP